MKVFIFTANQVYEGQEIDLVVRAYAKKDDAIAMLKWFIDDVKEVVRCSNWEEEYTDDCNYTAYEEGYYATNHVEFRVHEIEIEKHLTIK